ncbi:hypothetical protein FOVG_15679 [Fusarium oxysporum f. sp. pisi HDV247]|uniref:Mitochondrial dicarboxylate transporter n=1 Tax=Fusarium oxysporum f. sp. pisi HDV247 TaxID=1080344 RepID=W9NK19_FUSOX|nr:hypothetical protein FOVG_15679 [Fusarium oxysporum f. sp. pisi HDV247]
MSNLSTQEEDNYLLKSNNMSITMKPSSVDALLPSSNKYPFWFGGSASAMATLLTHPLDLVKVRLQSTITPARLSMAGMATRVITTEGYAGLYAGLSAAILRQFTYSTIRFGVYEDLKSRLSHDTGTSHSPMVLICLSALSGFIGGVAGSPADIVNVRMQSDMTRPLAEQRNYKHVFDGIIHITRNEGLSSLYRGVGANALRASLMNSSQLASYDMAKASCIRTFGMNDDTKTHLVASSLAGIVATTVCSPVDVVKTRIMGSINGEHVWQIIKGLTLSESPLWVFKGWVPSFLRLGPQTVLTLLILEQHKKLYAKMGV